MFTRVLVNTIIVGCCLYSSASAATNVMHVHQGATGANDGSSWSNALVDLQAALSIAQAGDQIWVAAGTYAPGPPDAGPVHFHLVSGVALYGGFAGTETELDQRDWAANETVLTGDLDGSGTTSGYQVLRANNLAEGSLLDGFIIRDGWGDGGSDDHHGGALRIRDSSLLIRNCSFTSNGSPWFGGAIHSTNSTLTLENSEFILNGYIPPNATIAWYGGAVSAINSTVTLVGCLFASNWAALKGGVIYTDSSKLTLKNCDFESNTCGAGDGGAIYAINSELDLTSCDFVDNWAGAGGTAVFAEQSSASMVDCTFFANTGRDGTPVAFGGPLNMDNCLFENNWGPALAGGGTWTIANSVFKDNEGGLFYFGGEQLIVTSSQFIGNYMDFGDGGGAWIAGSGAVEISDSVFSGNASTHGGGLFLFLNSGPVTISNCHFKANSVVDFGAAIRAVGTANARIIDSVIEANAAVFGGGAASVSGGSLIVERCTVFGNLGGGLHAGDGGSLTVIDSTIHSNGWEGVLVGAEPGQQPAEATIINSLIRDNIGDGVRIGVEWPGGPPAYAEIINSTISNNTVNFPSWQAGVFVETGHADIRNSIIWGNKPGSETMSDQINVLGGTVDVSHSVVQGLARKSMFDIPGANNISDDPLFVDPANGDFRLQAGSPAIDAGSNAFVPEDITTDLDGNPRIVDGNQDGHAVVDMGAYEFQPPPDDDPKEPCIFADLNCDGVVDHKDLVILVHSFGPCPDPENCPADLNGDGVVNQKDLLILLSHMTPGKPGKPGAPGKPGGPHGGGPP